MKMVLALVSFILCGMQYLDMSVGVLIHIVVF